jgi:CBS domain-containing protein
LRKQLLDPFPLTPGSSTGELAPFAVLINLIHDHIIRRSIQLSIKMLQALGMGSPPVPYAFLQFGSGGRQEQTLISDQDNGLVYDLPAHLSKQDCDDISAYFRLLVATIVQGLEEVGYPPCQGNVICSNNRWHGTIETWKETYDKWHAEPTWEHVRYLLLVSDARLLSGDSAFYGELKEHFRKNLDNNRQILPRLVSNTLYHQVPLGWFGRLLTEVRGKHRGATNVKNGVYLPFVNCIRLWALTHGIYASSTLDRLHGLREIRVWDNEFCNKVEDHFRQILGLRLIPAMQWQDDVYLSNSYLKLAELPKETIACLKSAMKLALHLQKITAKLPEAGKERAG